MDEHNFSGLRAGARIRCRGILSVMLVFKSKVGAGSRIKPRHRTIAGSCAEFHNFAELWSDIAERHSRVSRDSDNFAANVSISVSGSLSLSLSPSRIIEDIIFKRLIIPSRSRRYRLACAAAETSELLNSMPLVTAHRASPRSSRSVDRASQRRELISVRRLSADTWRVRVPARKKQQPRRAAAEN